MTLFVFLYILYFLFLFFIFLYFWEISGRARQLIWQNIIGKVHDHITIFFQIIKNIYIYIYTNTDEDVATELNIKYKI